MTDRRIDTLIPDPAIPDLQQRVAQLEAALINSQQILQAQLSSQITTAIGDFDTALANKQPLDADLSQIAAQTTTAVGRDLLAATDAASIRAKAGLGSLATQDAAAVVITGGSIVGITDLSVADGGTGASNPSMARGNLGLGTTLPLAISVGGTGDTGTAWSTWTPTVTPSSGTFTAVSAAGRYKQLGKTVFFSVLVSITTNGTAAGNWSFTVPVAANTAMTQTAAGKETAVAGSVASAQFVNGTTMAVVRYDNGYLGGNGYKVVVSGVYEAA
jgi:hypothetical protein